MGHDDASARAKLDAWRAQHADRQDRMRFHFIDALERRAASHSGEVRRMLDNRLSQLIAAYADDLKAATTRAGDAGSAILPDTPARGALGTLVDDIASRASTRSVPSITTEAIALPAALPELEVLGDFKKIWSTLRTDSQLRQSLEQIPADAGPLNSGSLVHRSLTLMHELSPEYLQQFLAYVDALSWIEQMNDNGTLSTRHAPRATGAGKRAQGKPRERRE